MGPVWRKAGGGDGVEGAQGWARSGGRAGVGVRFYGRGKGREWMEGG